jgi:PAS domain S-box-containing protein
MTDKKKTKPAGQVLRRRAEEKASADEAKIHGTLSPEAVRQLLHELRVHQIELETQNEELRRAQAELEASRARYFDLYDMAPVGYFTLSEQGRILEANLTAAALLGVARGALLGQLLFQFIVREDQNIADRHRNQLLATSAPQVCELRMLRQDGAYFWARLEATAARDVESGAPVCRTVVSDITAQKNIEEAFLRKAKELREENGGPSRFTRAVSDDWPGPPAMRQGQPVSILLLEDDPAHAEAVQRAFLDSSMKTAVQRARTLRDYKALVAAQTPDIAIIDLHLPDGNAVDVLASPLEAGPFPILVMTGYGDERVAVEAMKAGAIDYVMKSSGAFAAMPHTVERCLREWDLLQARKQAEEALHREKANFQHSLDDSPLGVRIVTANGDTLYANRAILEIYDFDSLEELRNTPVKQRYTQEAYVEFQKRLKIRQSGDPGPAEYEISIMRKNGEVRYLQVFRKGILWDGEKRFLTLYRDITEDKKREEIVREFEETIQGQKLLLDQQSSSVKELIDRLTLSREELGASYEALKANKDDLVRSEKLAFTGRMASSIAHEIRNPLTNIILSIRQLTKNDKIKPESLKYTEIMERNTKRIEYLITELLNCARPIKLNLRPWNIHLVIEDVLATQKVRLRTQRIKVIKNLTSHPSILFVDKEYLGRVFLNIIVNAMEAMPRRGHLSITTKKEKGRFIIKIRDNGRGIPEKNLIKIFDPFFSTKEQGAGLGLSTCQNIVTSHGGHIEVESTWRKGSGFSICLPLEPKLAAGEENIKGKS